MSKAGNLKELMASEIRNGVYLPGAHLPTRHELMERYGVARATVDKIIRSLADDGLVVSTRGSGTSVASACDKRRVSAFIVFNTDVECMSSGMMEREWSFIINDAGERSRCALIGGHELGRFLPAIRANPNARVVWVRPAMRSYAEIGALHAEGKQQIVVNRSIPRYNYVVSDVRPALEQAFARIRSLRHDATVAILPPFLNPEEHYLAEREIMFYELAAAFGFRVITVSRTASADHSGTVAIAREAIEKRPDFLYVPDYYMTPYVVTMIAERGLKRGRGITLITSDWNEAPQATPGSMCLRQPWRRMFAAALEWALLERPGKLQLRIPSEMNVNLS